MILDLWENIWLKENVLSNAMHKLHHLVNPLGIWTEQKSPKLTHKLPVYHVTQSITWD